MHNSHINSKIDGLITELNTLKLKGNGRDFIEMLQYLDSDLETFKKRVVNFQKWVQDGISFMGDPEDQIEETEGE